MVIPDTGRVLAVDWGEVRIGLALSDETQLIASPLGTLTRKRGKRFPMPAFDDLCARHAPVGLVVGLPLALDGSEGESAVKARDLAQALARRASLPVELWDERMTSARALGTVRELGGSTRGRKEDVDAMAATVLLQGWLEARRSGVRTPDA